MNKEKFLSGYCLEYAIALKDFYQTKGENVFIGGTIKYLKEEGEEEEEDVFEKTSNGIFRIYGFLDEVEVCHFFIGIKDKNNNVKFEDCNGIISAEKLKDNSLFVNELCQSEVKIVEFSDEYEAESFSSGIVEEFVSEAKNIIKKEKVKLKFKP